LKAERSGGKPHPFVKELSYGRNFRIIISGKPHRLHLADNAISAVFKRDSAEHCSVIIII